MTKRPGRGGDDQGHEGQNGNEISTGPRADFQREPPISAYAIDLNIAGQIFGSDFQMDSELFPTKTPLPDGTEITVPTHMVGQDAVRYIAYDNAWRAQQKDLARYIYPGEIAISIKHHSPSPEEGEQIKLQCTHIQVAVGVNTEDGPGVITINNPQEYESGLFGDHTYPMIFVKPVFPTGVPAPIQRAYINNIRTWLIIANTFTVFPGNYDGGDPLATRSVAQIRMLGDKLLEALAGDEAAIRWLKSEEHQVYCAELAHVALNLGIHYPLNAANLGSDRSAKLAEQLEAKEFLAGNLNGFASLVDLEMAPEDLQPIGDLLGLAITEPHEEDPFGDGLAIEPFTLADILEQFIQRSIPRKQMGEGVAPVQAGMLRHAMPRLLQVMNIDHLPESDPERQALLGLYEQLILAVEQSYSDYAVFRQSIHPLMIQARKFTSPRANGTGAFVPPHCFLLRATDSIQGNSDQGVFDWQYLGHGMHASILKAI